MSASAQDPADRTDRGFVRRLIEDALDADQTPDELCAAHPELAAAIRRQWDDFKRVESELEAAFPTPRSSETPRTRSFEISSRLPTIPGYDLESLLGRGGMGVVYKARHQKLKRIVAVKMLLAGEFASRAEIERFQKESQALAQLRHPNIVQVYDVGGCDGRPFFTMEYLEGGSLADKLAGAPLPARDAAALVATLAEGVQAAHDACIVHRDLKPSNILFTADGTPKIADCGVARRLDAECRLTQGEGRVGTPSYMAPEQAAGGPNASCPFVDIYALGAILYETLTGRPPFRAASSSETERQVVHEDPAPPSRLNRGVPRDLETICLKCLSKDPSRRYPKATALADDLRRFLRGEPVQARRAGLFERLRKWVRRRPALASASFAALVIGGALAAVTWSWSAERSAVARAVEDDLHDADAAQHRSDWPTANAAVARARARLGAHGSAHLHRRAADAERALQLIARLDAIRMDRAAGANRFNLKQSAEQYAAAFKDAGFDEADAAPEAVAKQVAASPIHGALVAALDDWAACAPDDDERRRLLKIATLADPDPIWRDRVRDPTNWKNPAALIELARTAPVESPSIPLFLVLATLLQAHDADSTGFMRRVQRAHPQDFWVNFALGELLDDRQEPDAVGFYRAALSLRPNAAACYANLGIALGRQGRPAEAKEYYEQALALAPESAAANYNIAVTLHAEQRFDEALAHAERALLLEPQNGRTLAFLADLYLRKGRRESAKDAASRALSLLSDGDSARIAAQSTLNHIDGKPPDGARIELRHARDLAGKQQWRAAAAAYAELVRTTPTDDGETWFEYAAVQLLAGDAAGYRKTCGVMIDRCGKSPALRPYHVARACTLRDVGDDRLETAARLSAGELQRSGTAFWSLTEQGALLVRAGRAAEAVPILEKSLAADSAVGRAVLNWLWLALAHRQLGHVDESVRWLNRFSKWAETIAASQGQNLPIPGFHLHNYLEASILSREADPKAK